MRYRIHYNGIPKWALSEDRPPHSFLDFVDERIHDTGDGKGPLSKEEIILRRQYEAAIKGNRKALAWLLKRIVRERADELAKSEARATVTVDGFPRIKPLGPVLAALGCIAVTEAKFVNGPARIRFEPWFEEAVRAHCSEEKVALALEWLAEGGEQSPYWPVGRDEND
jgi:hypothetical protein